MYEGIDPRPHKLSINKKPNAISSKIRIWTADVVNIVELIYAFDTKKCVDNGSGTLEGLTAYIGYFFGISIKDSSNSYIYMKKRKGDSRVNENRVAYLSNKVASRFLIFPNSSTKTVENNVSLCANPLSRKRKKYD